MPEPTEADRATADVIIERMSLTVAPDWKRDCIARALAESRAEVERERDAITRLCYERINQDPPFYRLQVDAAPEREIDYDTEAEAVAAVRAAAGLTPST